MPRITTTLFTGSILIIVLCQAFSRQIGSIPTALGTDLVFAVIFMFCAAGIITTWLGKPVKRKPKNDSDPSSGNKKKPPHDTAL